MQSISPIIILAKRAELFNEALGLSWDRAKAVFDRAEIDKLKKWFSENQIKIKEARTFNFFWQRFSLAIEQEKHISPFELLKQLDDLNYDKARTVDIPGEYAHRGEIIDIYPINLDFPIRIEFLGNTIERIYRLTDKELRIVNIEEKFKVPKEAILNLASGDFVVHLDHGVGRFKGIIIRKDRKYYELDYACNDMLLVPEGLESKLSPYLGFVQPRLTRLGGNIWEKTKRKVKEDALKLAKELLRLYAKREISQRLPYQGESEFEDQLSASFDYELTKDQRRTWGEITKDLSLERPMDRLICGDVGFGKTEIAIRTAFKIALNKRQVCLISPTTILADQHYSTFKERLGQFPINVRLLTRLISKAEQKQILHELKEAKVDILIGTHRLLSKDICFRDLGLLIIDEEQRFGVRQKEKLKEMRENVDILSLSATPIPRTLHMALSNLKDISLITTPPTYKLPIKTNVSLFDTGLVRKVIQKEILRHGQVYYLHNRIGTLSATEQKLKKLLPGLRIASLHGRMNERYLVDTIHNFRKGEFDVLIATSIIENGLDLKNVNTLIVEDATRLGLAQAHQIRGRVGRGERQSYAYFLYPHHSLTPIAKERLSALEKYSYLGAGYQLAAKDLEIRGAGNLLGREQSGAINKVGINLYYQILNQAVAELKFSTIDHKL
jgi:transcription-repair coupling factor (superfamily II helicase)